MEAWAAWELLLHPARAAGGQGEGQALGEWDVCLLEVAPPSKAHSPQAEHAGGRGGTEPPRWLRTLRRQLPALCVVMRHEREKAAL